MQTSDIRDYHAHVYYDAGTRPQAQALRERMEALFPQARFGRWHDVPVGPHPSAMYQVAFGVELFDTLVPWLIVNRAPLTIFLHPQTGEPRADHSLRAVWMGPQQEIALHKLPERD